MTVILDTNAVSALARKDTRLIDALEPAVRLSVTLITLAELTDGLRRSRQQRELDAWLREQLLSRVEILFPDLTTIEHYADIRLELKDAGAPIPANDVWIAALCRQHDLPLLSLDGHFDRVSGLTRVRW